MKEHFKNYISLGYNCQVSYSFEAFFEHTIANMFNWVNILTNDDLIKFFDNPDLAFSKGILKGGNMYKDGVFGFYYHSKTNILKLNKEQMEEDKKEVISRMTHLKEKFFNMIKSDDRNLFVIMFRSNCPEEKIQWTIDELLKRLEELSGNKNFRLVAVFEDWYLKTLKIKKRDKLLIRSICFFAHDKLAYRISYWDWYKIYRNFAFDFEDKNTSRFEHLQKFIEKWNMPRFPMPLSIKIDYWLSKLKKKITAKK